MIDEQVQDYNGEYSGICKYCGQIAVFQNLIPGEDANGTATRLCDCKQGRATTSCARMKKWNTSAGNAQSRMLEG